MPVSMLLCEGGPNSPDVRVLSKILTGLCEVKPFGGKYGMGDRIIARREILGNDTVYGILDRDFAKEWHPPKNQPCKWESRDHQTWFGWRWERNEIENYLLDPDIVSKALSNSSLNMSDYQNALEQARDKISIYQASRIALSISRKRFNPLASSFGTPKGKNEQHLFPDRLDEPACIEGIKNAIQDHQQNQIVSENDVIQAFERYKPDCLAGGDRYQHYLVAFSGKDLLWSMNEWFEQNNIIGAWAFREKVIKGIQNSTDDVALWLNEWEILRSMTEEF